MGAQISSYDIAAGCTAVLVAIELFTPTKPFTSTARLLKQFRSQVNENVLCAKDGRSYI